MRVGDILQGKYRVERMLGAGGMGFVVSARHLQLDAQVAIKSLLPQGVRNAEMLARFEREARAVAKIKSEHVARVLDVARLDDGRPYLVMEHLDGSDLDAWLRTRGPLPIEQSVELVIQACEAIAEAHTLGIVHRDLKPANLFVIKGPDGLSKVKVLDFGISKTDDSASGQPALTGTSSVLGSPGYMSPEQLSAPKTVDARTDIWSIGATLFELLSGRGPFEGEELVAIAFKIISEPAPSVAALRPVPAGLASVIDRCLAKDRAARYPDMAALAAALAPFAPSRTRATVEKIQRIVYGSRASSLAMASTAMASTAMAATAFATPRPSAAPSAPTQAAWSSQPRRAWESVPSEVALRPLVATVASPARTNSLRGLVVALAALASVFLVLAVCAVAWRRPSNALAAASPSAEPSAIAVPAVSVPPAPELSSEPVAAPSAAPAPFRGTHGEKKVTWVLGGNVYTGVVRTRGATGTVDVHATEPGAGPVVIREDLKLQRGAHGWSYVGSHPRYLDEGIPANFIPNIFYLTEGPNGTYSIAETCAAGTTQCARVQ